MGRAEQMLIWATNGLEQQRIEEEMEFFTTYSKEPEKLLEKVADLPLVITSLTDDPKNLFVNQNQTGKKEEFKTFFVIEPVGSWTKDKLFEIRTDIGNRNVVHDGVSDVIDHVGANAYLGETWIGTTEY